MCELFVDVVSDLCSQSGAQQTGVIGQVIVAESVRKQQQGRLWVDLGDSRYRRSNKGQVFAHQRKFIASLWVELLDRLGGKAALQRVETRGARARLSLSRDPGEKLVLIGADTAPKAGELCSVAKNDAAPHAPPLSPLSPPVYRHSGCLSSALEPAR